MSRDEGNVAWRFLEYGQMAITVSLIFTETDYPHPGFVLFEINESRPFSKLWHTVK